MIKEKVEKTSNELNYWFSVYANAISHVIHDMKAFDNYAPDHLHPFLISKVETYREKVSDFYFAYEASNRTLSGIGWIPPAEYVATSRPWYKKAKSAKGIVFTEPYVDAMTGDLVITVAHVLENDGRIMGVLASDIFLSEIVKVVENSRLNENSYGMLLDEKGRIIVHPNEDFLPGAQGIKTAAEINWEGYALLKDALLGESQISEIELQDYSGKNYVYHFSRIAASNWYFGIAIDKSEYQKPLRKLLLSFLISFFISMIVGIVIMGIVMNRITQPIKSLNNTVQQFAYDKAARTGIVSNDEIGELGTSFNQMADEIEEYGLKLSKNLMYVEKQSDSYARFVPEKLLRLFDKLDITEVEPRDCKALEMTVMFSDIRSYTAISESLSSRGVFEFLNNYFSSNYSAVAAAVSYSGMFPVKTP